MKENDCTKENKTPINSPSISFEKSFLELDLQTKSAFFEQIINKTPQIVYIFNPITLTNLYVNDQCIHILGYNPEKFTQGGSKIFFDILHPEDLPLLSDNQNFWKNADNDDILINEYRMQHQNGSWVWLRSQEVVFSRNEHNEVIQILGTSQDITPQKIAEKALIEAKELAQTQYKNQNQFLASMSHEIRTPMNGVLSMAQLLLDTNLTPSQADMVEIMINTGETLLVVINDILDLSKIQSGMFTLEKYPFALTDMLKSVCSLFNPQALEKDIYLNYFINPDVPNYILGDRSRLQQILYNLVGNAIKFTNQGEVFIFVTSKLLLEEKYQITISVKDTGIGINKNDLPKLFQCFSQGDASITGKYGGTGLGLAISQNLITLMEGRIWVESGGNIGGNPPKNWFSTIDDEDEDIEGSIFHFNFITTVASPNQLTYTIPKFVSRKSPEEKLTLKILVAEDYQPNQKVIQYLLTSLGYNADIVNNGLEVLNILKTKSYDVILMDMKMPEMDGITTTEAIRQCLTPQPYIIALTASILEEDRQKCLNIGMNAFISKPIIIYELQHILEKL